MFLIEGTIFQKNKILYENRLDENLFICDTSNIIESYKNAIKSGVNTAQLLFYGQEDDYSLEKEKKYLIVRDNESFEIKGLKITDPILPEAFQKSFLILDYA